MENITRVLEQNVLSRLFSGIWTAKDKPDTSSQILKGKFKFETRLVGTSHYSDTEKHRQRLIKKLQPGDLLLLKSEFDHPEYANLINILNEKNQNIGHLPSNRGRELRLEFEAGHKFYAKVESLQIKNGETGLFPHKDVEVRVYRVVDDQE